MQAPRRGGPTTRGHLVLIGATVRAAAEAAVGDGWTVSAVDLFGDVDTRHAAVAWYPLPPAAELAPIIARLPPGGVVVTGGVEDWYESLDAIRSEREVWVPSTDTLRTVREPSFLHEIAYRCDFAFPAWMEAGERPAPDRWLIKSRRLSGGLGVRRGALARPEPRDYFQVPTPGRPCGAAFLATGTGVQLIGLTRSMTRARGAHPFLYAGSAGPIHVDGEVRERLIRLGEIIRTECGLRGLFGVDLLCPTDGQQISLLEINPRYTAGMELLEKGHGPSLVTAHVEAFNKPASPPLAVGLPDKLPVYHVKRVVWARQPVRWDPNWQVRIAGKPSGITLHDIPVSGTTIDSGQPLVTLRAKGKRIDECLRRVRYAERQLMRLIANRTS